MRHNSINIAALLASAAPSAVAGLVRAENDPKEMIRQISASLNEFKTTHETRYTEIEAYLDQLSVQTQMNRINGGSGPMPDPDPEYTSSFNAYFRGGVGEEGIRAAQTQGMRGPITAAITGGSESEGGYLAPVEWDRKITEAQRNISPLRRICDVRVTTVGAYSTLWKLGAPGSGWVGELAARPATTTPTFASLVFGHGEIYANPAISQRMLDDSAIRIDEWLATEVSTEFEMQESIAFLSGNGVNKPFGILGYATGGLHPTQHPGGAIQVDPSGHASQLTTDGLVDFMYKLPSPYRQNARWLMNSQTAAVIAKMKDGDGNYIWRESFIVNQPATLLGRPVDIDENMPALAANALPILLGDFKAGYVINDRTGVKVLRDPYSNKPFVHFYTTKRVGGGVKDPNAIRALKIAAA